MKSSRVHIHPKSPLTSRERTFATCQKAPSCFFSVDNLSVTISWCCLFLKFITMGLYTLYSFWLLVLSVISEIHPCHCVQWHLVLCYCGIVSVSWLYHTHSTTDAIWVISVWGLLWIMLLWIFVLLSFIRPVYSLCWGQSWEWNWPGHRDDGGWALVNLSRGFYRGVVPSQLLLNLLPLAADYVFF